MTEFINHYDGQVAIPETEAEEIRKRNKIRQTKEKRRKWEIRRAIERRQEELALERELNCLY